MLPILRNSSEVAFLIWVWRALLKILLNFMHICIRNLISLYIIRETIHWCTTFNGLRYYIYYSKINNKLLLTSYYSFLNYLRYPSIWKISLLNLWAFKPVMNFYISDIINEKKVKSQRSRKCLFSTERFSNSLNIIKQFLWFS